MLLKPPISFFRVPISYFSSSVQIPTLQNAATNHGSTTIKHAHRLENSTAKLDAVLDSNKSKSGLEFESQRPPNIFQQYSFRELLRGLLVLKICSNSFFVKRASKLHELSSSMVGANLTNKFLEGLLFRHFVAGEHRHELEAAVVRFAAVGVQPMILPPMEDLAEEVSQGMSEICVRNSEKYQEFVDMCKSISLKYNCRSLLQFKLSSVIATPAMNAYSASLRPTHESLHKAAQDISSYLNQDNAQENFQFLADPVLDKLFKDGLMHCKRLFKRAMDAQVPILIDAELKDAFLAMYAVYLGIGTLFCKDSPNVFVTYQCYMKEIPGLLRLSANVAKSLDQCFAAKVVRGAYLEQERHIAATRGLPDPTWPNMAATSAAYDSTIEFMLGHVKERPGRVRVCVASHNRESIGKAIAMMEKLGIKKTEENVLLAQILGMCDNLTSELGSQGFRVYKSIAHGPAAEWIPYLTRRASENHTALATARNEVPIYWAEIGRRLKLKRTQ